mgnify:CR=1 FL=1
MGLTRNFSNPKGFIGKVFLASMNATHTPISKWALKKYDWKPDTAALDIGCGGGMNIKRMLKLSPNGIAAGVDVSEESVKKSMQINRKYLGTRCFIKHGSADNIPFESDCFDVVTAFETIYFWGNLQKAFNEIFRVLKNDGTFMAVCELSDSKSAWGKMVENIRIYTPEQLSQYMSDAGFTDITVLKNKSGRMCVCAKKKAVI